MLFYSYLLKFDFVPFFGNGTKKRTSKTTIKSAFYSPFFALNPAFLKDQ